MPGQWACPPPECQHCPDPPEEGDHLHLWSYGSMALYRNPDRSEPVGSALFDPCPSVLWVEGRSATDICGQPLEYRLCCPASTGSHCRGYSTVAIVERVASVEWEKAGEDSLDLDNCPNNGGKRIFPGKLSPDDGSPTTRRSVKLVATIEPPVSNVDVYFKVFDVDDPFDQLHADLADVSLIDDDTVGSDNRGGGDIGNFQAVTNADGRASVTLMVSMQPGNNYRAGASCLADAIDQADQATADAVNEEEWQWGGYSVPLFWSKTLTVWRKLHVETDSMVRPTFAENTVSGQWDNPRFVGGQLWVDIPDQPNNDDLENGYVRIQAAGFPDLISIIIDHESSPGREPVRTNINESTWGARPSSGDFVASDDDLGDEGLFTAGVVGSIIGVGIPPDAYLLLPDTSELEQVYQPAYILPVVEAQHTSEGPYPFYKNFAPGTRTNWDPGRLVLRGLPVSTSNFWTVYIFSAFQPEASKDCDSEPMGTKGVSTHTDGSTSAFWWWGNSYTGMAAIFAETLRDGYLDVQVPRTVGHEIAHTLGAPHLGAYAIAGDGGLMDETEQGAAFLAESLKRLREYVEP